MGLNFGFCCEADSGNVNLTQVGVGSSANGGANIGPTFFLATNFGALTFMAFNFVLRIVSVSFAGI